MDQIPLSSNDFYERTLLNLIRAHYEKDETSFRECSSDLMNYFSTNETKIELAEFIAVYLGLTRTFEVTD